MELQSLFESEALQFDELFYVIDDLSAGYT